MNWVAWLDGWFERRYDIREIGDGGYILKLQVTRHHGPRFVFQDGTVVNPGDPVAEFHMVNARVAALHTAGRPGLRFRREVYRLMAPLARDLGERPEYRDIKAVCGASLFWAEAEGAGFENRPLAPFTRWWLTWWERFLLSRYHPEGRGRLAEGRRTELRQVWLTRTTLERLAAREKGKPQAPSNLRETP
jgi:peptidoglycan-N-acetylglucosamine deacetylase